jgi:hypothetical protein
MHALTFTNEAGQRETLAVRGPRCVAEWQAAKLRRQRVTRFVLIAPNPSLQGTGHLVDRTLQGVVGPEN